MVREEFERVWAEADVVNEEWLNSYSARDVENLKDGFFISEIY